AGARLVEAGEALVLGGQGLRVTPVGSEFPAEFGFPQPGFPGLAQLFFGHRLAGVAHPLAGHAGADARHAADADGLQRTAMRFRLGGFMQVAGVVVAAALEQWRWWLAFRRRFFI